MVGRVYTWRTGSCSVGYWRVVCRWASIPGVKVIRNVLVEEVVKADHLRNVHGDGVLEKVDSGWYPTGKRIVRPWYPAPRKIADAG